MSLLSRHRREPIRTDADSPELALNLRKLWVAVLEATRDDIHGSYRHPLVREAARVWVASDATGVRSFRWVCEVLGVEDVDGARRRILGTAPPAWSRR